MRRISVLKWKAVNPAGKEEDASTLTTINAAILNTPMEKWPRGIDSWSLFGNIREAFDNAQKSGELILEEAEYRIIKRTLEQSILGPWAMSEKIASALNSFFDAREEKLSQKEDKKP